MQSIEDWLFYDCENLQKIEFSEAVTQIKDHAFCNCTGLTAVDLPDGVELIEECAFYNCANLKAIRIPQTMREIKKSAFEFCISLQTVNVPKVIVIDEGAFSVKTQVIHSDISVLAGSAPSQEKPVQKEIISEFAIEQNVLKKYNGKKEHVVIPDSVKVIGDYAFHECAFLKSVKIPDSVEKIGNMAFMKCTQLKEFIIPDTVNSLGRSVFSACGQLEKVTLSNNLKVIPESAFAWCMSLKSIFIPAGVTTIEKEAFGHCDHLEKVYISPTVELIGNNAFAQVDIHLKRVTVPPKTQLGAGVFPFNTVIKRGFPNSFEMLDFAETGTEMKEFSTASTQQESVFQLKHRTKTNAENRTLSLNEKLAVLLNQVHAEEKLFRKRILKLKIGESFNPVSGN